jgi:uncharacterized membrane protein
MVFLKDKCDLGLLATPVAKQIASSYDWTLDCMKRESTQESLSNLLLPLALILGLIVLLGLPGGQSDRAVADDLVESWLKIVIGYLAAGTEIAAAIVIGSAVVQSIVSYIRQFFSRSRQQINITERIRLQLGRVLALGLEFAVASDILRTAVAPTRQDILNLGAIVLLRTLLNYFLQREIEGEQQRLAQSEPSPSHVPPLL